MVNGLGYIFKTLRAVLFASANCSAHKVRRDSRIAAQGGAGLRWRPQSVKRFEAPTEPTGETSPLFGTQ